MKRFVVGICTLVSALVANILPSLTGKTVLTKMQVAVIALSSASVAATTIKALLTPTKAEGG